MCPQNIIRKPAIATAPSLQVADCRMLKKCLLSNVGIGDVTTHF